MANRVLQQPAIRYSLFAIRPAQPVHSFRSAFMTIDAATTSLLRTAQDAAGEVYPPVFPPPHRHRRQGRGEGQVFDPVTEADKGAERAIRAIIDRERPGRRDPGRGIRREAGRNGLRWVLDPVDGTPAFINGLHRNGVRSSRWRRTAAPHSASSTSRCWASASSARTARRSSACAGSRKICARGPARRSRTRSCAARIRMRISVQRSAPRSAACRTP